MSFFTAVIAADGDSWHARDVDVEDCADLDELADRLRAVAHEDRPVLCVIELEDGWFAIVRADDDESAAVFVSDMAAARAGHYGPVLSAAEDVEPDLPAGVHAYEREESQDGDGEEELEEEQDRDREAEAELEEVLEGPLVKPEPDGEPVDVWAGDPTLLAEFGVGARELVELVEENPDDPATVLAEVGEKAGFAELLETLR